MPRINGRRGAFQLLFAFIHVFVGLSFITAPAASSRLAALGYLAEWNVPTAPLAALWMVSAAVAAVSACLCRPNDWIGFSALVIAPARQSARGTNRNVVASTSAPVTVPTIAAP